jgi:hypothetical protein
MVLVIAVVALPFFDRSIERRPWKRPVAIGAYGFVLLALVGRGLRSEYLDSYDPSVAQQLAKQKAEEQDYMKKPFEPECIASESTAFLPVTPSSPVSTPR